VSIEEPITIQIAENVTNVNVTDLRNRVEVNEDAPTQVTIYVPGTAGNQGPQGPRGFQGPQGSQGPQGFQGVQGRLFESETPPASPVAGDMWFKSSTGIVYAYYDSFWVELGSGSQGPQGPIGPQGLSDTLVAVKAASATVIDSRTTGSQYPQFLMRANGDINIESGQFVPRVGRHLTGAIGFGGDSQIFVEQGNTATSLLMQAPRYGTSMSLFPTPKLGTVFPIGRVINGATVTSGSRVVSAPTANFTSADVGKYISGNGIPARTTTIYSIISSTSASMTATATATGASVTLNIGGEIEFNTAQDLVEFPTSSLGPYGNATAELIWDKVNDNFNSAGPLVGPWSTPTLAGGTSESQWAASDGVAKLTTAQRTVGTLSASLTASASATTFTTATTPVNVAVGDRIQINSERMRVTGLSGNTFTVIRAFDSSSLGAHAASAVITNANIRKTIVDGGTTFQTLKCTLGSYDEETDTVVNTRGTGVIVKYYDENNFIFCRLDYDLSTGHRFVVRKMINGIISDNFGLANLYVPYNPRDTNFKVRIDVIGNASGVGGFQYIFRFADSAPVITFFSDPLINVATKAGICFQQRAVDSIAAPDAIWEDFSLQTFEDLTYTNKVGNKLTGVVCPAVLPASTSTTQVHYKDAAPRNFIATLDSLGSIGFKLTNQGGQTNYDDVIMTNGQADGLIKLGFANTYWRNEVGLYFSNMASPAAGFWDQNRGAFLRPSASAGNIQSGARIVIQPSDITTYSSTSPTNDIVANGSGTPANPHLSVGVVGTGIYYTVSSGINQLNFATGGVRRATIDSSGLSVVGDVSASGDISTSGSGTFGGVGTSSLFVSSITANDLSEPISLLGNLTSIGIIEAQSLTENGTPVVLDDDPRFDSYVAKNDSRFENQMTYLKRWHREFGAVREGLAMGGGYQSTTDILWVGDSIGEGYSAVEPNATMVNVFTDNLSRTVNPKGRSGRWVPAGGDWFFAPKFSDNDSTLYVSHTISASAFPDNKVYLSETFATSKFPASGNATIVQTYVGSANITYTSKSDVGGRTVLEGVTINSFYFFGEGTTFSAGTPVRFGGDDNIRRGFSLRGRNLLPRTGENIGDTATLEFIGDNVVVHYRKVNTFTGSIRFSIERKVNGAYQSVFVSDPIPTYKNGAAQQLFAWDAAEDYGDPLPRGEYRLKVYQWSANPAGTNYSVTFDGAYVFDGNANQGVRVWNSSLSGAIFNTFNSAVDPVNNDDWLSALRDGLVDPSLVVIALGTNEPTNAGSIQTSLETMVAQVKAAYAVGFPTKAYPSFVFFVPPADFDRISSDWSYVREIYASTAATLGAAIWNWAEFTGDINSQYAKVGNLSSAINSSQTTIRTVFTPVVDVGQTILIDSEKMYVSAKSGASLTVQRGYASTTADAHDQNRLVQNASVEVGTGDPYDWSDDLVHPKNAGHRAIGDFVTSQALASINSGAATPTQQILDSYVPTTAEIINIYSTSYQNCASASISSASAGDVYVVEVWGDQKNPTNTVSYQVKLTLGDTVLESSSASATVTTSSNYRSWKSLSTVVVHSNDLSKQMMNTEFILSNQVAPPTPPATDVAWIIQAPASGMGVRSATENLGDLNNPKTLSLQVKFGSTVANTEFRVLGYTITRIR
jgi:hypothetical protein